MANINFFHNDTGAIFTDASQTLNIQQNNGNSTGNGSNVVSSDSPKIKRKIEKADLFRVIIALYELKAFTDMDGSIANQKDVFKAFGAMLGEDFSEYQNDLRAALRKKTDSNNIFEKLESALTEYREHIETKNLKK